MVKYMVLKFRFLIGVIMVMALASVAYADNRPGPQHSDAAWTASYWNNVALSGEAIVKTGDADISFDWGTGSPHASVQNDHFSARWQRYLDLAAGTYRFTVTSDDGIRIYVDSQLIINQWNDHAVQTFTADISLSAGHHQVTVEYYENGGHAVAKVSMAPAPAKITNWQGEYFNNRWLTGTPALTRDDADINFNWGSGSPAAGISGDDFSVRWTRTLYFDAGTYRFATTSDDGVRLWVNGHLLIDRWQDQAATTHANNIYIAGDTFIKMEYYERGGLASAQLAWSRATDYPPPPNPSPAGTVVVDDSDGGFVRGGSPRAWRAAAEGFNGQLVWTWNNDKARGNYNWGRWYPSLMPQHYEVFVYIPERYTTTGNARYWVAHQGGYTLRAVDQSANGGRWVSLGTYLFRGDSSDYVSLSDITEETYVSRLLAFDAVKWEPRW